MHVLLVWALDGNVQEEPGVVLCCITTLKRRMGNVVYANGSSIDGSGDQLQGIQSTSVSRIERKTPPSRRQISLFTPY